MYIPDFVDRSCFCFNRCDLLLCAISALLSMALKSSINNASNSFRDRCVPFRYASKMELKPLACGIKNDRLFLVADATIFFGFLAGFSWQFLT